MAMVKHNVLVRRLAAVETLGSASVLCLDFTFRGCGKKRRATESSLLDGQRARPCLSCIASQGTLLFHFRETTIDAQSILVV